MFSATSADGRIVLCSYNSESRALLAGRVNSLGRFTSFKKMIKEAKRRAAQSPSEQTRRKVTALQRAQKRGLTACREALRNIVRDPATPTPTPQPTPQATPTPMTPEPPSCSGNFDPNGNTCPNRFGIPSPLTGNIARGRSIQTLRCNGCHVQRTNYQFGAITNAINNVGAMNGVLSGYETQQATADLVAYLNRFNQ
jgi:hypothetical protein